MIAPAPLYRGDVVLIPFPFTDLSGHKVRPAVIVSPDPQQTDVLVAFITSRLERALESSDLPISPQHPEFAQTGLKGASVIRTRKMSSIDRFQIQRRLGRLGSNLLSGLNSCLPHAVGLATRSAP